MLSQISNCVTLPSNEHLSFRLYQDNQPCCLETAALQKGLVLVYNDKELIEEGIGFGVPVIKYRDKTIFSSQAQTSISKDEPYSLEKRFVMDTVSRKRFYKAYVNDDFYEFIHKLFEKAYLGHNNLLPINNKIMELREMLKIKTEFVSVKPRGVVTVKYACSEKGIKVTVDFSNLELGDCLDFLVLNEQGANAFNHYIDTDGLKLVGRGIGAWNMVNAKQATLNNAAGNLAFSLETLGSAQLFRGWEKTRNRFSWAGLSYSLKPNMGVFKYTIMLN